MADESTFQNHFFENHKVDILKDKIGMFRQTKRNQNKLECNQACIQSQNYLVSRFRLPCLSAWTSTWRKYGTNNGQVLGSPRLGCGKNIRHISWNSNIVAIDRVMVSLIAYHRSQDTAGWETWYADVVCCLVLHQSIPCKSLLGMSRIRDCSGFIQDV